MKKLLLVLVLAMFATPAHAYKFDWGGFSDGLCHFYQLQYKLPAGQWRSSAPRGTPPLSPDAKFIGPPAPKAVSKK
jgi:hypothetical protein